MDGKLPSQRSHVNCCEREVTLESRPTRGEEGKGGDEKGRSSGESASVGLGEEGRKSVKAPTERDRKRPEEDQASCGRIADSSSDLLLIPAQ
jgi:hypothetical protein